MSVISIYTTNPAILCRLTALLEELGRRGPEPIRAEGFSDFAAFLDSGRRNPRRILMLAQEGTRGVELMATAVEECPDSPTVWLSDLDFALFSYRLAVDHFVLLPGTEESLRAALRSCGKRRRQVPRLEGPPAAAALPARAGLWERAVRLLRRRK